MYYISNEVIKFIEKTMENWRVELIAGGKGFAEGSSKEMSYHHYFV